MKEKKILHFITNLKTGGAQKMLLRLLTENKDTSFEHVIYCFRSIDKSDDMTQAFNKQGIKIHRLNVDKIYDISAIFKFRKILQTEKPDALMLFLTHTDIFGRIFGRIFGIKTIISSIRINTLKLNKLLFLLDGITTPLVSHFHFNSLSVAKIYQKYFFIPESKTTYIPNGLASIAQYIQNVNKRALKTELNIPTDSTVLGVVARLDKQKNHKLLIESFNHVIKTNKNIILLLIGDGNQRNILEAQIKHCHLENSVLLLGTRTDVPKLLQIIDIFIAPSLYEGMSNSLLEAMAAKKAIIASDIPENTTILKNNESVLFFDRTSISDLSNKIEILFQNTQLKQTIADAAYNELLSKYTIAKVTKQYNLLWKKLLNKKL